MRIGIVFLVFVAVAAMFTNCGTQTWSRALPCMDSAAPLQGFPFSNAGLAETWRYSIGCLDDSVPAGQTFATDHTTATQRWDALLSALNRHGVYSFTISPDSYEALGALLKLRCIVFLAVIDYTERPARFPERTALLDGVLFSSDSLLAHASLQAITRSRFSDNRWELETTAGFSPDGLPTDPLVGQVVPMNGQDGSTVYRQIGGICILTRVPPPVVEGHLDEWYAPMPAQRIKPAIVPPR